MKNRDVKKCNQSQRQNRNVLSLPDRLHLSTCIQLYSKKKAYDYRWITFLFSSKKLKSNIHDGVSVGDSASSGEGGWSIRVALGKSLLVLEDRVEGVLEQRA